MSKVLSRIFFLTLFALTAFSESNDSPTLNGLYLGQMPPGLTPELFAPHFFNNQAGYHTPLIFSPDLTEVVWSPMARGHHLLYMKMIDQKWSKPQELNFGFERGIGDATFSSNGDQLYFLSFQAPFPGAQEKERIWFVDRIKTGWSEPQLIDSVVLAHKTHWTFSFAKNCNLYFTSENTGVKGEQDLYVARFDGEKYLQPEDVGEAINTAGKEFAPFVAPDEQYLIFTRIGENTKKTDLFISFKDADGNWLKAINMGERINSESHDLCASVTPDGEYLFFISQRDGTSRIYWVDAKAIGMLKPHHPSAKE